MLGTRWFDGKIAGDVMLYKRQRLELKETERESMRAAGRFNGRVMDLVRENIRPGITTGEIDRLVETFTRDHGHVPATLGYPGQMYPYPKSCCTSVNDVICHGIPGDYELREGDIVNVDLTSIVAGWHGDSSETFLIGEVSDISRRVSQCAFDCMWLAIDALTPNCRISEIGDAIVRHARKCGFSVVQEYVGHGLGKKFHQPPTIPHDPTPESRRQRLQPGLCFTIEPMINSGAKETFLSSRDGWTVRTKDGGLSAQFEHTILMTEEGPEVLTLTKHGPQRGDQLKLSTGN
ncbi:methionine aminopeptidase, type I [Pirellula staleyi DSM 6068]|uniref:Methionine aminopeptidase n=1 Tax=Pirellula staleyi (strain ATCC 27377 / DSM 6068 / ICPB 4128) TaxID=530564 RepID=D2QY85_PIRSD|nr:type I methionyl aminopeptidase [Pirellula staleyi]ADB16299.1 methionine aminopeptidase, type I [Pirellula staleyi DSM 6068]